MTIKCEQFPNTKTTRSTGQELLCHNLDIVEVSATAITQQQKPVIAEIFIFVTKTFLLQMQLPSSPWEQIFNLRWYQKKIFATNLRTTILHFVLRWKEQGQHFHCDTLEWGKWSLPDRFQVWFPPNDTRIVPIPDRRVTNITLRA